MIWQKTEIKLKGEMYKATAPVIVSASRATDIPAFFAAEFIDALNKGFLYKANPFNGKKELISFQNTRLIVFWSKNPKPLIPYLEELDKKNIHYYFQFTLNDYEKENLEPFVPEKAERIETFIRLSEKIGKEKVIWRFDPVFLIENQNNTEIIERIVRIAKQIHQYTEKLVFSFADFSYRKVQNNLRKEKINYKELSDNEQKAFGEKLAQKLKSYDLPISTCAQKIDLSEFGISHNKCIDDELIARLFPDDEVLMQLIRPHLGTRKLKDKGQRKYCGCIYSKDIGKYNTCSFMCKYCYANTSFEAVKRNKKTIFK